MPFHDFEINNISLRIEEKYASRHLFRQYLSIFLGEKTDFAWFTFHVIFPYKMLLQSCFFE